MRLAVLMSAVGFAALVGASAPASAATVVLDDFTVGQFVPNLPSSWPPPAGWWPFLDDGAGNGVARGSAQGAGILGGERDAVMTVFGKPRADLNNTLNVSNGSLSIGSFFDPVEGRLIYNGVGDVGLGGVNLFGGRLLLDVFSLGTGLKEPPFSVSLELVDTQSQVSRLTQNFDSSLFRASSSDPGETAMLSIALANLVGGADLSKTDSISIAIRGPLGLDAWLVGGFRVDEITTPVSEPGGLPLLAAGLAMLGLAVRRNRKVSAK